MLCYLVRVIVKENYSDEYQRIRYVMLMQQNDALIFNNTHFEYYVWMLSV